MNKIYHRSGQYITYSIQSGKSPFVVFLHGLMSDMHGTKAVEIEKFLKALSDLSVGELSNHVVSKDGIHSLMLCKPIQKDTINNIKENIETRLRINKINNASILLLNRIKQKSLIEVQGL